MAAVPDRGGVIGRVIVDCQTIHVHDLQAAEAEFPRALGMALGLRTMLATPLVHGGVAIGAIQIRRREVRPFSDRQIKLLETFADQAVIAIENARLIHEQQARNRDLTEALEQQTATSDDAQGDQQLGDRSSAGFRGDRPQRSAAVRGDVRRHPQVRWPLVYV